tara:strand:- start:455 stop:1075 length:621 start_codon:yes stop_codon:yes gene_type:complete
MRDIKKYIDGFNDPWDVVELFESKVANYAGSKYAVSTDNCTDAIFLCLKYHRQRTITIPKKTYISVPQTIIYAGCSVLFDDIEWKGIYQLQPYSIWDGATRFRKNMYRGGYHCLSFHHRKHIPIGKGGMILTDDNKFKDWARIARYEGRSYRIKYEDDKPRMIGWNMYMTPEQAALGIMLLDEYEEQDDCGGSDSYYDLSKLEIFV